MHLTTLCYSPVLTRRTITKILLIMKLTSMLLIISFLQVSGEGFSQKITLNVKNAPLKLVFREIKKQSGYSFVYGKEQLAVASKINLNIASASLEEILELIFKGQPLTYTIIDKYIAIKRKAEKPDPPLLKEPVPIEIRGRVMNEKGEAIPGATVAIKGTNIATQTNADGTFVINAVKSNDVLVISSVGYEANEVPLAGETNIGDIILTQSTTKLDQVIVTGYGSQQKKDITGSVASVNVKQFKEVPGGTPEQLLQGRAAGVNVISSGVPGGGSIIRVRGITSFGGSEPLVVIDGTRGSMHDLNPNDIQEISVLKDAGAAAIYGATGGSGVILITTKKGRAGKTTFTYDGYYGTQVPAEGNVFNLLNTQEMADVQWLAFKNSGQTPSSPQYGSGPTPVIPDYIMIGPTQFGVNREPTQDELDSYNIDYSKGPIYQIVRANKQGTDYFHEIFNPEPIQSHTITASGGAEKSAYLFSLGYFNQQGTLLNTYLKRYSVRINTMFSNTKKNIRMGENIYAFYKENPGFSNLAEGNAVFVTYRAQPVIPVYDIFGGFAGTKAVGVGDPDNPVAMRVRAKNAHDNNWGLLGNVFGEVDFLKHFTARTQFGGSVYQNYAWALSVRTYESNFSSPNNGFSESSSFSRQWVWTNTINYAKTFLDKHSVKVLVGTEAIRNYGRNVGGSRQNYFVDDPNYANLSTGSPSGQSNFSGASHSSISSYLGQLDYGYSDKYLLGVRFRRDGASVFGSENRYGNFPSVSLAWRVSNENFMRSVLWISELKLRGSWGKLGSLSNTPPDNQYNLFGGSPGDAFYDINGSTTSSAQGFRQTRIGSLVTGWEEDIITNVGLDVGLFRNKFDFSIEWYKKKISGLLFSDQAHIYGVGIATLPLVNIGDIQNSGIDASFTYHGTINKDFRFDVDLLFSKYKTEIINIPNVAGYFTAGGSRIGDFVRNEKGHPISAFFGYDVIGLFQSDDDVNKSPIQNAAAPGRFKYRDANGDGEITPDDRVYIGDPNPDFTYGLNLSAAYNNFDFSIFFYGSQGNDVINYVRFWTDFYGSFAGVKSKDLLYNSWTPQNLNAKTPIAETITSFSTNSVPNSYYREDGSYFRCKSLVIGYTITEGALKRAGIGNLRFYLQAANLFTITNYTGIDPELSGGNTAFGIDYGNYPNNQKSFLAGISLSF